MVYVQAYEPSIFSSHAANYAKKMSRGPTVEISLDSDGRKSQLYTTGSPISGRATITAPTSTCFDEIQITLEGQSRVALEYMSQLAGHSTIEASHTFLKLNMPIPDASYPHPRTLEAHEPISVPFNFCIPAQLLPQACTHKCAADHVHDAHMQLPPSMDGINDHTPDMGRVHYFVAVKLLSRKSALEKSDVLSSATQKIKVLPEVSESPPLHIEPSDTEYQLVRTKNVRKGMFKGKLGDVTFSATQPKPFVVNPTSSSPSSITAPVTLQFHPKTPQSKPPKIGTLTAKIKTSTYSSVKAQKDLAKRVDHLNDFDPTRGTYTHTTTLATMTLDSTTAWKYLADAPIYARRDSGYETCRSDKEVDPSITTSSASTNSSTSGHYEAQILVPLSLPSCKNWLPTFHSCLISRIYSLELSLTIASGSGLPTSMTLRVPIQVAAAAATVGGDNSRRTSDVLAVDEDMEMSVDESLRPRLLSVPDARYRLGSVVPGVTPLPGPGEVEVESELPPGYAGGLESYVRRESAAGAGLLATGFE